MAQYKFDYFFAGLEIFLYFKEKYFFIKLFKHNTCLVLVSFLTTLLFLFIR